MTVIYYGRVYIFELKIVGGKRVSNGKKKGKKGESEQIKVRRYWEKYLGFSDM